MICKLLLLFRDVINKSGLKTGNKDLEMGEGVGCNSIKVCRPICK